MKWHKEAFGFVRAYNKPACCERCHASKTDPSMLFTDFGSEPAWARTLTSHSEWLQEYPRHTRSPLATIPGFSHETIRGDVMHVVNLGVAQWALGSCFIQLLEVGAFGGERLPANARLRTAYRQFRQFTAKHRIKTSQPRFTLSRLGRSTLGAKQFPIFKGKAWNTRCVCAWLSEVATANKDKDGRNGTLRALCIFHLASWFAELEETGRHLNAAEAESLKNHGLQFLRAYGELAKNAIEKRAWLYPLRPKLHKLHHICLDLLKEEYNPRFYCCYTDEDFCGQMKRIAVKVHRRRMAERTLQRYRIMLGILWRECREGTLSENRTRRTAAR